MPVGLTRIGVWGGCLPCMQRCSDAGRFVAHNCDGTITPETAWVECPVEHRIVVAAQERHLVRNGNARFRAGVNDAAAVAAWPR